jgi:hypothetical protein
VVHEENWKRVFFCLKETLENWKREVLSMNDLFSLFKDDYLDFYMKTDRRRIYFIFYRKFGNCSKTVKKNSI